ALDPMPFASGMSLRISSSIGGIGISRLLPTATAVCQIRLSEDVEICAASRPSARIASASARRNRHVRYTPSANPSESNPGPRLALEAGTRTVCQPTSADLEDFLLFGLYGQVDLLHVGVGHLLDLIVRPLLFV